MEYFCPKCGKVIKTEEVEFYKETFSCKDCSNVVKEAAIDNQYTLYICSGCLSYVFNRDPKNSLWRKSEHGGITEVVLHILKKEMAHSTKSDPDSFTLSIPPITDIPTSINITSSLSGLQNDVNLLIKHAICKNCSKMLSRRFDAVIQLRTVKIQHSKPHTLLDPLIDEVIAHTSRIQQKHPEQFISDIDELSNGFDLKLSNKSIMASIQSLLTSKYSFIIKTSKKLMGKNPNTGGDLYRTYILLRYLPFHVDDVLRIKNDTYIIKKITANRIQLENLNDNSLKIRNLEFFEKKLIHILEA